MTEAETRPVMKRALTVRCRVRRPLVPAPHAPRHGVWRGACELLSFVDKNWDRESRSSLHTCPLLRGCGRWQWREYGRERTDVGMQIRTNNAHTSAQSRPCVSASPFVSMPTQVVTTEQQPKPDINATVCCRDSEKDATWCTGLVVRHYVHSFRVHRSDSVMVTCYMYDHGFLWKSDGTEVTGAVEEVTAAVEEVTAAVEAVTGAVEEVTGAVEEANAAVEEVTGAVEAMTAAVEVMDRDALLFEMRMLLSSTDLELQQKVRVPHSATTIPPFVNAHALPRSAHRFTATCTRFSRRNTPSCRPMRSFSWCTVHWSRTQVCSQTE